MHRMAAISLCELCRFFKGFNRETGTASGGLWRTFIFLRSSEVSVSNTPVVLAMVASHLKSSLVSGRAAFCPHCFSILL